MLIKKKKLKCRSGNLMFEEKKKKKMELRETDVRRFGKKEDQNNVLFHISAVFFWKQKYQKRSTK